MLSHRREVKSSHLIFSTSWKCKYYYFNLPINFSNSIKAPLWQQVIDWCDSKGLLVGTIVVDNLYKSTINKINYETELFCKSIMIPKAVNLSNSADFNKNPF